MRKHKTRSKQINDSRKAERKRGYIIMFKTRTFSETENYAKKVSTFVYKETEFGC